LPLCTGETGPRLERAELNLKLRRGKCHRGIETPGKTSQGMFTGTGGETETDISVTR
jgi:hypothetical protein